MAGRGPLGPDRAGWFSAPVADPIVYVEPHPRRVQAIRDGRAVIDSENALLVHRAGAPPSYAFSAAEAAGLPSEPEPCAPEHVRSDLLHPTATSTYCNCKGYATYWAAVAGGTVVDDVAWSYAEPMPETRSIAGLFSFDPDRADVFAELPVGG